MSDDRHVSRVLDGSADLVFVEHVLDTIEGMGRSAFHVPDMDRTLFMLAVSEIATNIATHNSGTIAVRAELDASSDGLRAILRDTAPPANIAWESVALADIDAESGRGLALARSVLDEFRHEADAHGNTWILVRRLRNLSE